MSQTAALSQLAPIEEPFSAEVEGIFSTYPKRDGYILQLFRVFGNSTRFLKKGTLNLLDRDSPLSMLQREIIILRVTARNNCEYEWGVHVTAFSQHVGLSETQVRATYLGNHTDTCWNNEESLLIQAVDELCDHGKVTKTTYELFKSLFNVEQQLEVFALCGNYHTVSFVANTAGLPGESFAATFPLS